MNNKTIKVLSIVCAIPLVLCIIGNLILLVMGNINNSLGIHELVNTSLNIFVAVFGIFYIFSGCNKAIGGELLKLFICFFALIQLFMLFDPNVRNEASLTVLVAVKLSMLSVLGLAKDVGEFKSKVLSLVVIGASVAEAAITCTINASNILMILPRVATSVFLAIAAFVLICAKYEDKRQRGTK